MPRRKGYGIPPTKRIKIENEPENDENEPNDGKSENTRIDAQKSNNENCTLLDQAPTNTPENISNSLANATTNGSNKYLHKKFKKMVAILSDDSTSPSSGIDQSTNRVVSPTAATAASAIAKDLTTCHSNSSSNNINNNSTTSSTLPWTTTTATTSSSAISLAAVVASSATSSTPASTSSIEIHHNRQSQPQSQQHQNHASSIHATTATAAVVTIPTTTMQSSLPKLVASTARNDGKISTSTTTMDVTSNHLSVTRECNSTSPYKSSTGSANSEDDGVATVAAKCVCPYCDLVCSKPSVLEKHLRAHTNERPYPCLPCGFSFKTRSNLLKHCRTSRSHSLKLEEAGVENNIMSGVKMSVDEDGDEMDDDAQVSTTTSSTTSIASIKDESSSNDENKSADSVPRAAIYKPKFHKAAIYIQNNNGSNGSGSGSGSNAIASAITALPPASSKCVVESAASTMNKLGLQLKIPAAAGTTTTGGASASSTPSTPSPFTSGSSPSPEFLHRHISKLISENQAIVETTDPFWSKKFYQRSKEGSPSSPLSNSSSSSLDSFKKIPPPLPIPIPLGVKQHAESQHNIEDKLPVESKLAHALLQPRVTKVVTTTMTIVPTNEHVVVAAATAVEDAQPLNLSICKDTRMKSYLDEDDDKTVAATPSVEFRLIGNEAPPARFVPNGRISSSASGGDVYMKDAHHHAFVKSATLGDGAILTTAAAIAKNTKLPIIEHMCSLCDETFDNYDKLKAHILYQCKGNKNHSLSSASSINNHLSGVLNKPAMTSNDARVFLRVASSTCSSASSTTPEPQLLVQQQQHSAKPANLNQSPGPRLGNTPLIGNYKKLSVITTGGGGGGGSSTIKNNNHILIEHHKSVTSLKSLEELSNAPMKGTTNHFVYNAALMDDSVVEKSSSSMLKMTEDDLAKNSIIVSKTLAMPDDQKLISIKSSSTMAGMMAKPKDTSSSAVFKSNAGLADLAILNKTTSSATPPKFVLPVVQGVPNLASLQGVPAAALLAATTNSAELHALSPLGPGYRTPTTPTASLPKAKSTHVNGGVVTILHGGKVIPYVPGMPGPQSAAAAFLQVDGYEKKSSEAVKRKYDDGGPLNGMIKHANHQRIVDDLSPISNTAQGSKLLHSVKIKDELFSSIYMDQEKDTNGVKFARPSSLPLKPGTFIPKKLQPGTSSCLPLISPETPRPNKSYGQLYIGGNAYTYLGLKCSTRSTFCTLHKSQPTYVPLSPEHNKVSMYSNWKIRSDVDPYLRGVPPTKAMSCYDSRQRYSSYTVVHTKMKDAVTHSSYWFNRSKQHPDQGDGNQCIDTDSKDNIQIQLQGEMHARNSEDGLKNNKYLVGGIESTDEYTYIRGQGRGKYVCLKCGIRCKKPSMLKKHIRTHTDVRPYICKHCVFRFKTKGNLTKHMKSKAHYKKCMELGIVPVPTVVDDSYVDEEILSKQTQQIEEGQDVEETEEEDDDDDDDDDEENDEDFIEDKEVAEDPKCQLEREVARSLLSLSKMSHQTVSEQYANAGLVPLNARPNTYPYNFSANAHLSSKPHTPTLTLISEQKEQEKVSKNTGLARELQPIVTSNAIIKPKNESHTSERYYFGSAADKEHVPMETNDVPSPEIAPKEPIPLISAKNSFVERSSTGSGGISAKIETFDRNNDIESKENVMLTPTPDGEKAESSTSVIISIGSPNSNFNASSPKRLKAEFISPCSGPLTNVLEDGRSKCAICNKIFSKQSQLRLHVNIHYFEQPFRCESCAVSFRTRNNLQKHLGSNSHLNKVSMNSATGGQTSTNNPRPFKCDDCNIGFRIHGHLAKHLRSKMHIMKLECLGKLPFGTYAEMERCGINMNDIDTTDCENSLESLQRIAKGVVNSVTYINSADEENKMGPDSSF
ncbi:serine-rich adhesin for platelets isoform X2 [Planococcus citri]|uniref:serine-rich adhesin for platelets isoform X2 n=1 Tax=Planococcus citri TaxID=170843 RepID=UPI0031F8F30B